MEKYKKDYKNWVELQKILDDIDFLLPFNERELWWVSFGINVGIEIDGKGENFERPAVIIKKYNKEHAWAVPITRTTLVKEGVHIPIRHSNLDINSVAVITQLQTVSAHRLTSLIGILSPEQFIKILDTIKETLPKYTKDLG